MAGNPENMSPQWCSASSLYSVVNQTQINVRPVLCYFAAFEKGKMICDQNKMLRRLLVASKRKARTTKCILILHLFSTLAHCSFFSFPSRGQIKEPSRTWTSQTWWIQKQRRRRGEERRGEARDREGKVEIRGVKREKELSGREEIREKRWTGALVTADASLDLLESKGALQSDGGGKREKASERERRWYGMTWNTTLHLIKAKTTSVKLCRALRRVMGLQRVPRVWNGYEFEFFSFARQRVEDAVRSKRSSWLFYLIHVSTFTPLCMLACVCVWAHLYQRSPTFCLTSCHCGTEWQSCPFDRRSTGEVFR